MRDSLQPHQPPMPSWIRISLAAAVIYIVCAAWLTVLVHRPPAGESRRSLMIDKLDSIERAMRDLEQASATAPPVSLIGQDQAMKQWAGIYLNYRRQVKELSDDSQLADYEEIQDYMRNAYALENRSEQIRKEIIRGRMTAEQAKGLEAEFRGNINLAIAEIKGAKQQLHMPARASSPFPKAGLTIFLLISLAAACGLVALLLFQPAREGERQKVRQSLNVSQRSLQECENRVQAIFQTSQDGLVLMDDKGYIQQFSPAAEKLFGVSSVDIIGQSLFKLLPTIERARMEEQLRKLKPARDLGKVELSHRRADGTEQKLEMNIRKAVEGRVLVASLREVPAGAATDETLQHELGFLSGIFDAARSYLVVLDRRGRILRSNRASEVLAGRPSLELRGRHFSEVFTPRNPDAVRGVFQQAAGQQPAEKIEEVCPSRMGDRVVSWSSTLVPDAEGEPEFVVMTGIDMTGIRRQAAEKSGDVQAGQLIGEVALNLGNLLTNVSGYADLVLANTAPDNPSHADILEIKDSGERAGALVRKLLSWAGRNAGRAKVLDLNAAATAAAGKMAPRLGKDVELHLELAPHAPQVLADSAQLAEMVGMLFDNAREAMPAGGHVALRTGIVESGEGGGSLATLSVSDSGRGFSREAARRLFDPFYTTKDPGKGSGLSLAAIRGMLQQAGGRIRASGEPGKGATIEILLPLAAPARGPVLVEKSSERR